MMASQELAMRNTAAHQKQIMRFMPLIFGFFLARFPAGLFVYWVTSNLIILCQNYLIYRHAPHPSASAPTVPEGPPVASSNEDEREPRESPKRSGRAKSKRKKGAGRKR